METADEVVTSSARFFDQCVWGLTDGKKGLYFCFKARASSAQKMEDEMMEITLAEIIPMARKLPPLERLHLIHILAEGLDQLNPVEAASLEADKDDAGQAVDELAAHETEAELVAEDARWEATLTRQADKFAALKAQAKAAVQAHKTVPMFDSQGKFAVE